ncbi:dermonecrotic toxin domain-containing protein [Pseudomonas sp. LF245]
MSITTLPSAPSTTALPLLADSSTPDKNTDRSYKRPERPNTLVEASHAKAVLTPEGASPAYFKAPLQHNKKLEKSITDFVPPKSPNEITSEQVQAHIEEKFGFTIDPDKTFLVTIVYDHRTAPPYKGYIVQKISLTEAARRNIQDYGLPFTTGHRSPLKNYYDGAPPFEIDQKSRHNETPSADGTFPAPDAMHTTWFQGIYTEPYPGSPNTYDVSNQMHMDPEAFKQMVWDNAYKKPYDNYLDTYWSPQTRTQFAGAAKTAYMKAAHEQHHDGSLTEDDRKIAMRVAGLPPDKTYLSATPDDLKQPYVSDPNLETKFLTFNGFESRMFYTRDKTTHRTLLYIPGYTPPLKGFNSPEEMNRWLGKQLEDPAKAEALKFNFRPEDRPNYGKWVGLDARMDVTSKRLKESLVSKESQEELGFWKEGGLFDGKFVNTDPFEELQYRTEKATKSATHQQFVLNSDVTKNQIMAGVRAASYGLLLLTPLGIAFAPAGIALTLASVALGVTQTAIGIDDKLNARPGADDRILKGLLNTAKPILSDGMGRAFSPVSRIIRGFILKP